MRESLSAIDSSFPDSPQPASLPVSCPTASYWLRDNPLEHVGQDVELPVQADIVILGSGISGISALYHAVAKTEMPLDIVVLEARGFCSGATGRNGGHCSSLHIMAFNSLIEQHGLDEAIRAVRLEQRCIMHLKEIVAEHRLAVDLVPSDLVTLFEDEQSAAVVRSSLEAAQHAGVGPEHVEWLETDALKQAFGVTGFYSGVRLPGNNLFPHRLVQGLYRISLERADSKKCRLSLHTHTPATMLERTDAGWSVQTARGSISTKLALHATNAYATHLLPELCATRAIVPCRNQVIAVRPSSQAKPWTTAFAAHGGFDYLFQRPRDDEKGAPLVLLGGGRHVAGPPHELGVSDDSTVNLGVARYLRSWLPKYFPPIFPARWLSWLFGGVEVEHEWSGIMGFTRNHDPLVGPVMLDKHEGQYICAGFSGHGMSRAFSCSEAVVDMMLAQLAGKAGPSHPDWLPRHFGEM